MRYDGRALGGAHEHDKDKNFLKNPAPVHA